MRDGVTGPSRSLGCVACLKRVCPSEGLMVDGLLTSGWHSPSIVWRCIVAVGV